MFFIVTVSMTIFFFTLTMKVAHGDVKINDVKLIVIIVSHVRKKEQVDILNFIVAYQYKGARV
jgi:hypothetical protein